MMTMQRLLSARWQAGPAVPSVVVWFGLVLVRFAEAEARPLVVALRGYFRKVECCCRHNGMKVWCIGVFQDGGL